MDIKSLRENEFHISKLIAAHLKGELTQQQEAGLNAWLGSSDENSTFLNEFYEQKELLNEIRHYQSANKAAIWNKTRSRLQPAKPANLKRSECIKSISKF